jgi:hypothetical protein
MVKFIIAGRRKREDTQERYFYEWGIIHVALMVTSPAVMRLFRRYVQHFSIAGISNDMLIHPLSEMEWDSFADHWVETLEGIAESVRIDDYLQRVKPHVFGDKEFVLQFTGGETIHEESGFRSGGVKLIHFLARKPDLSQQDFVSYWRERHAPVVLEATGTPRVLRKYVQSPQVALDGDCFKGTIFQAGGVNPYAGVEEFWFDSVQDLARLRRDPRIHAAITGSEAQFVDPAVSFSMVVTERVIYDYTLGDKSSPPAAVLNPGSLEAAIYRQGLSGWNVPRTAGE